MRGIRVECECWEDKEKGVRYYLVVPGATLARPGIDEEDSRIVYFKLFFEYAQLVPKPVRASLLPEDDEEES